VLTGRPGSGKTTAVRGAVAKLVRRGLTVTGFVTDEVREGGTRTGFDLVVLQPDGRDGARHGLARVGLPSRVSVGRYGIDTDAVTDALPALTGRGDVVVVDEVAPMELAAPGFTDAVEHVLTAGRPLLAIDDPTRTLRVAVLNGHSSATGKSVADVGAATAFPRNGVWIERKDYRVGEHHLVTVEIRADVRDVGPHSSTLIPDQFALITTRYACDVGNCQNLVWRKREAIQRIASRLVES
jgi:nucleoside-triphosphatase